MSTQPILRSEVPAILSAAGYVQLTKRERQLAQVVGRGCTNKEIATAMRISIGTVKVYLSRLTKKRQMDRYALIREGAFAEGVAEGRRQAMRDKVS